MLILPVAQPYGDIIRSNSTRCPPASTIAMLTGLRNSFARCLLASRILRARSIVKLTDLSFLTATRMVYRPRFHVGASITDFTNSRQMARPAHHFHLLDSPAQLAVLLFGELAGQFPLLSGQLSRLKIHLQSLAKTCAKRLSNLVPGDRGSEGVQRRGHFAIPGQRLCSRVLVRE